MKLKKIVAPVKFWKRILAYLIDLVVINIIILYPFKNFFSSFKDDLLVEEFTASLFVAILAIAVLTVLYFAVAEYFLKQTVGKAMLDIYVRSKTPDLKLWQCLVRNLPKVSTAILFVDSLGVIFRGEYQRYFEKISNTEVVDGEA